MSYVDIFPMLSCCAATAGYAPAMTERPEAVVVCEKHEGRTEMLRLRKDDLTKWLDKYRLGQLWVDGQLGGKRW